MASPEDSSALAARLRQLSQHLSELIRCTSTLWGMYQEHGPGQMDPRSYEAVRCAVDEMQRTLQQAGSRAALEDGKVADADVWTQSVASASEQLDALSRQCVGPQGLSFISGEAGLVPRPDQHRAFQSNLNLLEQRYRELLARQRS